MHQTIQSYTQILITRIQRNRFWKNVLILAGGSGSAQLIAIAATPFLTRIFTPDDFGVLTTFLSVLSIIVVVAALRYEIAIPLPDSSIDAAHLYGLGGLIVLLMTGASILILWLLRSSLSSWSTFSQLGHILWLLPLGILLGGLFQISSYWHIRERNFKHLTQVNISQSGSKALGQLILGVLHTGYIGLINGYIFGRFVAVIILLYQILRSGKLEFKRINFSGIKQVAIRYRRFPIYSSWSALLNQSGAQIATILLAFFWGTQVTGWFGLAQRVGGIPIGLVGRSVSQVYLSEVSRLRYEHPLAMKQLFLKTSARLFLFVGMPIVLLGSISPWMFSFIFGEKWHTSGWYVAALLPMLLGQIVVSPLAHTMNILERQDLQLVWDFSRMIAAITSIALAHYVFKWDSLPTLALYGFVMFGMYVILFLIILRQINRFLFTIASDHLEERA